MKNFLRRLILAAAFVLALVAVTPNAQAYTCLQYDPTGIFCIQWSVDLIPHATWCGANPVPASNEVLIFTQINFAAGTASSASNPLCQRVQVTSAFQVSNLQNYDLDGVQYHIQSVDLGHNVFMGLWSGNFSGTYNLLCGYNNGGSCPNSLYFQSDIHQNWGYYPQSFAFGVEP